MTHSQIPEESTKNYERLEILSLIIGGALTIIPIILASIRGNSPTPLEMLWMIATLFISIVLYSFAGRKKAYLDAMISEKRHDIQLKEISNRISTVQSSMQHYVEPLGLAREIPIKYTDRLMSNALSATQVRNTLVFFSSQEDADPEARQYTGGNSSENRRNLIEVVVKRRVTWTDIYSEAGLKFLNPSIRELKEGEHGDYYVPKVLKKSFPVVNFALFDFPGDRSEVWFGFGLFNGLDGAVFRSTSPALCNYFRSYFSVLEMESRPWAPKGRQYLDGVWTTVNYNTESQIDSVALIQIFSSSAEYSLRGTVFIVSGGKIETAHRFNSTSSKYSESKQTAELTFTFRDEKGGEEGPRGFGRYYFRESRRLNDFTGQIITTAGDSIYVYGHKLNREKCEAILENSEQRRRLIGELLDSGEIAMEKPTSDDGPFTPKRYFV